MLPFPSLLWYKLYFSVCVNLMFLALSLKVVSLVNKSMYMSPSRVIVPKVVNIGTIPLYSMMLTPMKLDTMPPEKRIRLINPSCEGWHVS